LLIDVVGNTLVFMPLGFGLAGALHRGNAWQTIYRAALGGFLVSLAIELLQLAIPSRATDVDDLIFNSLGALLGALLFYTLYYQIKRLSENVESFK
jgi:glycopeptide antibiotics resistance protein